MSNLSNDSTCWYQISAEEVLRKLKVSSDGLSSEQVSQRQSKYGANRLPEGRKVTLLEVVVRQFLSPLIYVLVGATILSVILGEIADAIFILIVLAVNALIGTIQEWKAETSAKALQQMVKVAVTVVRNGKRTTLNAIDLVPGDLVFVESGNKVPADIRLLEVNNLLVEEAILTGESVAVEKKTTPIEGDVTTGDQLNMLFAGTIITSGRAKGVVVATGVETEIGKIAENLQAEKSNKAPLVKRMERFSKNISYIVLVACFILGVGGYYSGIGLQEIFFFVIAIAVSAIPEGLPISMTVALSTGAFRMSKRNVIIRKLTAVEGLGSCTMISTDKTGTLTVDQQTVRHILLKSGGLLNISGQGYNGEGEIKSDSDEVITYENHDELDAFIRAVVICNEGSLTQSAEEWKHQGDAVDVALLALAYKAGTSPQHYSENIEVIKEIPFESERKYAAVYYRKDNQLYFAVKGAAEVLLKATLGDNKELAKQADKLAEQGFRYIAVAGGKVGEVLPDDEFPEVELFGFVALLDPPREEVKPAIEAAHAAGVDVCMITGDHPATALSIARDLGIAKEESELVTGKELAEWDMDSQEFADRIKGVHVFARVSPQQKQGIVQAQQRNGHFVAVTGDGVNDAPALKTANMGVAMGYGTDVAKEVSSIIITDNNFASIVAGIEEGRYTYANLRKIIYLLISTGAAELIMIGLALGLGTPLPFLPAQILWLNLVTNGIQDKVLAFEKGEKELMKDPPRSTKEGVFNKYMVSQTLTSALVMALLSFGLWYHLLYNLEYSEESARNLVLLLMVLLQNFHVFNCRSETRSIFQIPLRNNKWLLIGIAGAQGIHILSMYIPFMQNLLAVQPVEWGDWAKLFLTASLIVLAMEIFKWFRRRKYV